MVIVRLMGGLGNQMFQYAAARRVALSNNVPLKLDISWFARSPDRAYALRALSIEEAFASPDDLRQLAGPSARGLGRLVFRLRRRFKIGHRWTWIQERRLSRFDRRLPAATSPVYLDGYWQSERYFGDIADTIRRDFTIAAPADGRSREIADQIVATESVSVHVRRGDYVSDPRKSGARSVCTPDYYRRCVTRIAERLALPPLFLFSDAPRWVPATLQFDPPPPLVSRVPAPPEHEDLRLMGAGRHHTTANSSFSWGGAWLNPSCDKLVLAPRRWM